MSGSSSLPFQGGSILLDPLPLTACQTKLPGLSDITSMSLRRLGEVGSLGRRGEVWRYSRGHGIKEDVKRRDLPVPNDDHIQARIVWRLAARTRAPSQATGILESLRF